MKKLILSVMCGALTAVTAYGAINPTLSSKSVSSGKLETFTIYSPEMQRDMTVDVLLPAGYDPSVSRKVVYMHDGQNLFDAASVWNGQSWEMDEAVAKLGSEAPIVVGVYSTGGDRMSDLMPAEPVALINPQVADEWLAGVCNSEIRGDKYVDFIALTLKPEIDAHYATIKDASATSVMGSSMGGLASMYAMCRHPEVFGAAGCLSTHFIAAMKDNEIFPTAFAAYLTGHFPLDGKHRIYFDTGDQTLDQYYGTHFSRIMKMLEQMGCTESELMYKEFPGQSHDEQSWASRVDIPLAFILGNVDVPSAVLPDPLYIIGNINGSIWATTADKLVGVSPDAEGKYVYSNLTFDDCGNGKSYFSFITQPGANWDAVAKGSRYGAASHDLTITVGSNVAVKYNAPGTEANAWAVSPGSYDVTVDLTEMTMKLTPALSSGATMSAERDDSRMMYGANGMRISPAADYHGIVIEPGKQPYIR